MLKSLNFKRNIIIFIVGLAFLISGFFGFTTHNTVQAVAAKAEGFCSFGSSAEKAACRNGYRGAAQDNESKEKSCGKQRKTPYSTDKQKKACEKGYDEGKKQKADEKPTGPIDPGGKHQCGNLPKAEDNFKTKIDFGCLGTKAKQPLNPIIDLTFAIIRFLTTGVGIVIIIGFILAGIQHTMTEGNPEASAKARKRIEHILYGLLVYIFAWAIIQFLVPGGVFS